MVNFILNTKIVATDKPETFLLLDFIRYQKNLTGTKIGCREGDCGACTVLVGELKNNELQYRSFTSCLTPIGNVAGKHVVTVEGLNMDDLNPIQQAMIEESATQCGFCTPGFVVSLAGFCLSTKEPTEQNAIAAIDGNICRCTGYKSIARAAAKISQLLQNRGAEEPATFLAKHKILPEYFTSIKERLQELALGKKSTITINPETYPFLGGGTDLYVQKHDQMQKTEARLLYNLPELNQLYLEDNKCIIGGAVTVTDLKDSSIIQEHFPSFLNYFRLVSSTPIRNMATIAGNIINASPIGDFTVMLIALRAKIILTDGINSRQIRLRDLYKGYKQLDKKPEEYIEKIWFELPDRNWKFNFEKVSKRTHLDIASVNSAMGISLQADIIQRIRISAGGVSPIPMYLEKTSTYLTGRLVTDQILTEALEIAQSEISPISDARGSETYKRLLLNQLIKTHFLILAPQFELELTDT
ncbi:FAD binding domain-containing protein [Adhaeribacter aquaticus]|uniref:FAD binding domain-containing protein n=1 Tax=Adhaeribacter aquaticus TaxID=299567 RepID=UPI00047DBAFF|nr:FAD binding domain-containing protein [Adhaeribacter aquaticus]